jgi:hypothetical protein
MLHALWLPEMTIRQGQAIGSGCIVLSGLRVGVSCGKPREPERSPSPSPANGLTLAAVALYKKDWSWWIVGAVILVIALFFQRKQETEKQ